MQAWIIHIMNQFGYIGILLLIAIENIFPPIPSEVILTFGGFMTTYTSMNFWGVVIFATAGSIFGAVILYEIGRLLNQERLNQLLNSKLAKILHFKKEDVSKAEGWFSKRGKSTVFFCRFIPVVRSLISIPAGIAKMDMVTFLIFTTAGSFIWNIVLVYLGALAGSSWEKIVGYMNTYSNIFFYILASVIIILIIKHYYKRPSKKTKR